jgi:hypothetical protein
MVVLSSIPHLIPYIGLRFNRFTSCLPNVGCILSCLSIHVGSSRPTRLGKQNKLIRGASDGKL